MTHWCPMQQQMPLKRGREGGWKVTHACPVPTMGPTVTITKPNSQLVTHHLDIQKEEDWLSKAILFCLYKYQILGKLEVSTWRKANQVGKQGVCLLLRRSPRSREALRVRLKQVEVQTRQGTHSSESCMHWEARDNIVKYRQ